MARPTYYRAAPIKTNAIFCSLLKAFESLKTGIIVHVGWRVVPNFYGNF